MVQRCGDSRRKKQQQEKSLGRDLIVLVFDHNNQSQQILAVDPGDIILHKCMQTQRDSLFTHSHNPMRRQSVTTEDKSGAHPTRLEGVLTHTREIQKVCRKAKIVVETNNSQKNIKGDFTGRGSNGDKLDLGVNIMHKCVC